MLISNIKMGGNYFNYGILYRADFGNFKNELLITWAFHARHSLTRCKKTENIQRTAVLRTEMFHWWESRSLQLGRAETHVRMHNTSNLGADGLREQKTTSGQPRTEIWGYSVQRLTQTGQLKTGGLSAGLMNLDFCSDTDMVGSESSVSSLKPWTQPALCQQLRLVLVV